MASSAVKSSAQDRLWRLICRARSGDRQASDDLLNDAGVRRKAKTIAICLKRKLGRNDSRSSNDLREEILSSLRVRIITFSGSSKAEFWKWLWSLARTDSDETRRVVNERRVIESEREDTGLTSREGLRCQLIIDVWWDGLDDRLQIIVEHHVARRPLSEIAGKLPVRRSRLAVRRDLRKAQKELIDRIRNVKR